jgi:predicted nucleic acid-binding Zn ribbon protein
MSYSGSGVSACLAGAVRAPSNEPGKPTMKCMICGKQAPSGARLCTPCRAALRRARKATVSHFQPLHRLTVDMRARRARRKSAKASPSKTAPRAGSKGSSRFGRQEVAMFVALSVVACAMGVLAIRLLDEGAGGRPAATTRVPVVAPQPAAAAPAGETAAPAPAPVAPPDHVQESAPPAAAPPARPAPPKLVPGIWPMEDAANRHDAMRVASASPDAFGDVPERAVPPPEAAAASASPPPTRPDGAAVSRGTWAGASRAPR